MYMLLSQWYKTPKNFILEVMMIMFIQAEEKNRDSDMRIHKKKVVCVLSLNVLKLGDYL